MQSNAKLPDRLFDFIFFPRSKLSGSLDDLANLAEKEDWDYKNTETEHHKPMLYNYINYTYERLSEEGKVAFSVSDKAVCFNTGLVTPLQEQIFCYAEENHLADAKSPWHFTSWCREGERKLLKFSAHPLRAHYFDEPSELLLDVRKSFIPNLQHILQDHDDRFSMSFRGKSEQEKLNILKGAIFGATSRASRNYKTAIPQYHRGQIQLLLPLCLTSEQAELALVVERENHSDGDYSYRATTCLTLDMAYNNARLLVRPDRDWLQP